jgi:ABC-2 type transport system ATP-binding protein
MIHAKGLRHSYPAKGGPVHALNGVDLDVAQGTIRAVLGPNGAGKTTTVKVLTTLLRPEAGAVHIDGIDVLAAPREAKRIIGVSGQYAAVDESLTALENLEMIGRLYHLSSRQARNRAHELVERFDLGEASTRPVKGFSGGMRRRVDLAGALVAAPRVLFLDEPTTGLDPRSRLDLWEIISELVADGATVLLTTQYLEEADQLADSISVIDHGTVIAEGTPDELKAEVGDHRLELTLVDPDDALAARAILARFGEVVIKESDIRAIEVAVDDARASLAQSLALFEENDIALFDAGMRRPTLDDVFLKLTGRPPLATSAEDQTPSKEELA